MVLRHLLPSPCLCLGGTVLSSHLTTHLYLWLAAAIIEKRALYCAGIPASQSTNGLPNGAAQ